MMNRNHVAFTLTALLAAGSAWAGGGKGRVQTYSFASSSSQAQARAGEDVSVIVSGEGSGEVVLLSGAGEKGARTLRMKSSDGRMIVETEPDATKPWLGVLLTPTDRGIEVGSVMEGSPAGRAGLLPGDLILAADDRDLAKAEERGNLLEGKAPGDTMRLRVLRDGGEQTLRVRLEPHPGRMEFELAEDLGPFGIAGNVLEGLGSLQKLQSLEGLSMLPLFDCGDDDEPCLKSILSFARSGKPRLGLVLDGLSPQLAEYFGVREGEGMLIKEVGKDSVAERAGVKAGDVLVRIDDTDISSLADIRGALKEVGKGQAVSLEVVRRGQRERFTAELDTDPGDDEAARFELWPALEKELDGTQGILRRLEEDEARRAAGGARSDQAQVEAELRAVEESRATRRSHGLNEAQRTF